MSASASTQSRRDRLRRSGGGWAIVGLIALSVSGCPSSEEDRDVPGAGLADPANAAAGAETNPIEPARPMPGQATPSPTESTPAAPEVADSDPTPSPGLDERIGAVLDADPEGAGLDTLIHAASVDEDPSAREAAVVALGDSEDPRALDALIAATEDPESGVAIAAIEQLRWFDDRLAENAIRRRLDSPDPEIARAAREALAE